MRAAGYQHTTVADVVREAAASRRTFYAHFKDLDAAYLALFEAFAAENLRAFAAALSEPGPPRERLASAVGSYLDAVADDPTLFASFFRELHLTGERGRASLRRVNLLAGQTMHELSVAVRDAEPDLHVEVISVPAARLLTAGTVQMALMALDEDGDLDAVRDTAVDLLSRVLLRE